MKVRIRDTGEVMLIDDYCRLHPNVSFPQNMDKTILDQFDLDIVYDGTCPDKTPLQRYVYDGAEKINGQWYTKCFVEDLDSVTTASLIADEWIVVRRMRDGILAKTDWTQVNDAPVDQAAWAVYRQALRDITEQSDPFNIIWPTPPQ